MAKQAAVGRHARPSQSAAQRRLSLSAPPPDLTVPSTNWGSFLLGFLISIGLFAVQINLGIVPELIEKYVPVVSSSEPIMYLFAVMIFAWLLIIPWWFVASLFLLMIRRRKVISAFATGALIGIGFGLFLGEFGFGALITDVGNSLL